MAIKIVNKDPGYMMDIDPIYITPEDNTVVSLEKLCKTVEELERRIKLLEREHPHTSKVYNNKVKQF